VKNSDRVEQKAEKQSGKTGLLDDPQWMGPGQSPVNQVKIQFWTLGCVHKNRQSKQIAVTNTWEPLSNIFLFFSFFLTEAMTNSGQKEERNENGEKSGMGTKERK